MFRAAGLAAAAFSSDALPRLEAALAAQSGKPADSLAGDEDFWFQVRHMFSVDRNIINLNNGGVSPAPKIVMESEKRYLEISNMGPAHFMWKILGPELETVRRRIAQNFGVDPEEIAITRNASEALEIVQMGMDLKRGDEILTTNQDYGRMITTWQQRERRDGLLLKQISFPVPAPSLADLAQRVERAVTPKTKVIHICHVTNRTGQIFPVKAICAMAKARGIEVVVDGAHAFGQFPFKQKDLGCDYYGTSLHKWILAPIGTGFLYVKKEKIGKIWPLMAAPPAMDNDIRKFEEIGTHPASQRNSITEAITFHESIGAERKAARFRYLRKRWQARLRGLPGVTMHTSDDPEMSCAIGTVGFAGFSMPKLAEYLMEKHKIMVVPIVTGAEYSGLRVTPNVYTTIEEVDTFAEVMEGIVKKGPIALGLGV
ncbi:aminotransferase class V-fold PLP-dependent enzyme [Bryobacter aggregatus]|uniref:aminotransferase class V-fold PLP-dependent enzyme n=1 Tax=Bryobacter aggregatus TaxID=360054 RepID=UPI000A593559|nr:aminotransferase class V-fold PLP-dependent enzyme [Bryobacter aggregatus]